MSKSKTAHTANSKPSGDWHVSHTGMGMGDYYGTGIKAKIGKLIDGYGINPPVGPALKKPPKKLG